MATLTGSDSNGAAAVVARRVPTIIVNDEPRPLGSPASVAGLIAELGLEGRRGIAIAVNGSVIPRGAWPEQALREGDRVLVIRATQGG